MGDARGWVSSNGETRKMTDRVVKLIKLRLECVSLHRSGEICEDGNQRIRKSERITRALWVIEDDTTTDPSRMMCIESPRANVQAIKARIQMREVFRKDNVKPGCLRAQHTHNTKMDVSPREFPTPNSQVTSPNSQMRTQTHPIIIKHASPNLVQNIPCRALERSLHINTRLGAGFDEKDAFFLRPELGLFGGNLA